jgi:hypothetical protein
LARILASWVRPGAPPVVGAVEGCDLESLVVRLAAASRTVHEALLVLDD